MTENFTGTKINDFVSRPAQNVPSIKINREKLDGIIYWQMASLFGTYRFSHYVGQLMRSWCVCVSARTPSHCPLTPMHTLSLVYLILGHCSQCQRAVGSGKGRYSLLCLVPFVPHSRLNFPTPPVNYAVFTQFDDYFWNDIYLIVLIIDIAFGILKQRRIIQVVRWKSLES